MVLKDFNIEEEAKGSGNAVIKNFTAYVTGNTLEIHFYWAGKGTECIPNRGTYGPLISAISVDPGMLHTDITIFLLFVVHFCFSSLTGLL